MLPSHSRQHKVGAQKKGTLANPTSHTFKFCAHAETALSDHAGLLMPVVTKTSEIENRDQRKEIESVS